MNKNKTKFYLLIIGIISIISIPIIYNIKKNASSNELNKNGIKTNATVENILRSRNLRTRTFNYSISLKFKDENGNEYLETIPIDYENFRGKFIGQKIEILYMKLNPNEIELVDFKKYYKTEERTLSPDDLSSFYKNNHSEFILDRLNKISAGWYIKENDSTLFVNERRKSFMKVNTDSISYFINQSYDKELNISLEKLELIESKRIKRKNEKMNPFKSLSEPKQKFSITTFYKTYKNDEFKFSYLKHFDYSNQAWSSLNCKK